MPTAIGYGTLKVTKEFYKPYSNTPTALSDTPTQ